MYEGRKEIVAGRAFYFMPSPFCGLKITIEEKYNPARMERAIRELEKVHPIVNNVVVQADGRLWFQDIGKHIRIRRYSEGTKDWKTVYMGEAAENIDLSKDSGIKVAIVEHQERFELLLLFHHIYADGISAKRLLSDLISLYVMKTGMAVKESLSDVGIEMLEGKVSVSKELTHKVDSVLQEWNRNKTTFDTDTFKKLNELHHRLARYELTVGKVEERDFIAFRKKCKECGVTVNSALVAAVLTELQTDEVINTIIPVNARPYLDIIDEEGLANLASALNICLQYKTNLGFWENVSLIHNSIYAARLSVEESMERLYTFMRLDEDVLGAGYHAQYGMYNNQSMMTRLQDVLKMDAKKRTLDLSNIGELQLDNEYGKVHVSDCYVIPNFTVNCDWMFAFVSLENTLGISFMYSSRRISCKLAEEMMGRIIRRLCENT